jgi:hypothetical protein
MCTWVLLSVIGRISLKYLATPYSGVGQPAVVLMLLLLIYADEAGEMCHWFSLFFACFKKI